MTTIDKLTNMGNDRPINNNDDDKFKRGNFAQLLITQILSLPTGESFVFGLSGPWGSGKTSVLNMVENELSLNEHVVVVWFNPWLFSGTNDLVEQFFSEIAAQIVENQPSNEKGKQVAGTISNWLRRLQGVAQTGGTAIAQAKGVAAPVAAAIGAAASMTIGAAADRLQAVQQEVPAPALQGSLRKQRKQLEDLLVAFGKRIVVIVDDIDRLHPNEVREIVRFVRLTADFPNVYYLLAFDRFRVEKALGDDVEHGRAYLEKIFQTIFDLPPISQPQLHGFLAEEVNRVLENKEHGPEHSEYLQDLFRQGISPLFRQPRDVRRYINSLHFSLGAIKVELSVPDVLGLEAIRTLLPETFSLMQANAELLAVSELSGASKHSNEKGKTIWKAIVESAGEHQAATIRLINLMFPYTNSYSGNISYDSSGWLATWRRQRRVACLEHFSHYLSKVLPEGALRASHIESIVNKFDEQDVFIDEIRRLSSEEFSYLVMRLEDYQDEFNANRAETVLPSLINVSVSFLKDNLYSPDYVFTPSFRLKCIVVRWLRRIETAARPAMLISIFDKVDTLSWKSELWDIAKNWHEDDYDKKPLIAPDCAEQILNKLLDEIALGLSTDYREVMSERRLFLLLDVAISKKPELVAVLRELAKQDEFLISIIKKSLSVGYAQAIGSSVRRPFYSLPWKLLKDMFEGDFLNERLSYLGNLKTEDKDAEQALAIALEYVTGKRTENSDGSGFGRERQGDESPPTVEIEAEPMDDTEQDESEGSEDLSQTKE